jgi:hypothetical protein
MIENRGPALVAVWSVFLVLTWLFVGLRMYVRVYMSKSWGLDDALLVYALVGL